MKLFPVDKKFNIKSPLMVGFILFLLALFYLSFETLIFNLENENENIYVFTWEFMVGAVIFGPVVESLILVLIIFCFKKIGMKAVIYLPLIAAIAMLAHIPAKDDLKSLPIQFFAFYIYAYYIDFRSEFIKKSIYLYESIIMHAFYNFLWIIFPFFIIKFFGSI